MHLTTLTRAETVAEGTMAFHIGKPNGFTFRAGQAIDLTLPEPAETDASGNVRAFSLASGPARDELVVATRMREGSAFKRSLAKLQPGAKLEIEGPTGSLTLHKNQAKPAVLLAGGIGITPFLSIVEDAVAQDLPHQLFLFYSNRRPEDAPFLPALDDRARRHPRFTLIPTMTSMQHSRLPWTGATGYINGELIRRYVQPLQGPIYYIAGPPAMVAAMREQLISGQVDEDDIRTEEFAGY
jgi:ferredoxin-NADP reductase